MVNKAVIGVIGVILVTTLGVGALVGLQGGSGPADDANPNGGGGNGNGQQSAATPTATGTVGDAATSAPTGPQERTPIPARQFNRAEIERNVTSQLNDWRRSHGLSPLTHTGTTAENLKAMARDHSVTMANEGTVGHVINGVDTAARFENHDMFDACQYQTQEGYIAQPGSEGGRNVQFEYVSSTVAGGTYESDGITRFNENERQVAQAIVDDVRSQDKPPGVTKPGIERVGVGVEITRTGGVYATVHLCGG